MFVCVVVCVVCLFVCLFCCFVLFCLLFVCLFVCLFLFCGFLFSFFFVLFFYYYSFVFGGVFLISNFELANHPKDFKVPLNTVANKTKKKWYSHTRRARQIHLFSETDHVCVIPNLMDR